MNRLRHLTAVAAALGLAAAACGPGPAAPPPAPTPRATRETRNILTPRPTAPIPDEREIPDCDSPAIAALGMGLKVYATEDEARAALGDLMLWPAPGTVPSSLFFKQGRFNAQYLEDSDWKQSTLSLVWGFSRDPEDPRELAVLYMSQPYPFTEPEEPHGTITLRGGKTAYTFKPPFRPGLHSLQWQEDCRVVSVVGDLPPEELLRIAEGLRVQGKP